MFIPKPLGLCQQNPEKEPKRLKKEPAALPKEQPEKTPEIKPTIPLSSATQVQQSITVQKRSFNIAELIKHGKSFYNCTLDSKKEDIGIALSLERAAKYAGTKGYVASMPQLFEARASLSLNDPVINSSSYDYFWNDWFTTLSEENVGIDKTGKFVSAGSPVVIVVHGGGILTPKRIFSAYREGLTPHGNAKLSENEFENLLKGTLPDGKNIEIYTVTDIKKSCIPDPFGRYAIALDYFETEKEKVSKNHKKKEFMANQSVWARVGTLAHLENYWDLNQELFREDVENIKNLKNIDPRIPQSQILISNVYDLSSIALNNCGKFVSVTDTISRTQKIK